MIPWNQAYSRTVKSKDFLLKFGKQPRIDEFRFFAQVVRFDALKPALLATSSALPNTGDQAVTLANIATPTTNIVPGPAVSARVDFPEGAIILAITSCAQVLQRVVSVGPTNFPYGPSNGYGGALDLFSLDLDYSDGDNIYSGNPIAETVSNPNSSVISAAPGIADALVGNGTRSNALGREILVTPGLGLIVTARSLLLPNTPVAAPSVATPNLSVHLVMHLMALPPKKKPDRN